MDEMKYGVCRVCGCTDNDPCNNPNVGNCWWADETHTICSHCADMAIAYDPETRHCIESAEVVGDDDSEFQMQQEYEELYDLILSGDIGWDYSHLNRLLELHLKLNQK